MSRYPLAYTSGPTTSRWHRIVICDNYEKSLATLLAVMIAAFANTTLLLVFCRGQGQPPSATSRCWCTSARERGARQPSSREAHTARCPSHYPKASSACALKSFREANSCECVRRGATIAVVDNYCSRELWCWEHSAGLITRVVDPMLPV